MLFPEHDSQYLNSWIQFHFIWKWRKITTMKSQKSRWFRICIPCEAVTCRDTIGCEWMWANVFEQCMQCSNIIYRCQHKLFNRCPNRVHTRQPFSVELKNSSVLRSADAKRAKFYSIEWKSQWTVNSCNSMKSNIWPSGKSARKILTMCCMCTGVVWMNVNAHKLSSLASSDRLSITGTQRHCRQHHYSIRHK